MRRPHRRVYVYAAKVHCIARKQKGAQRFNTQSKCAKHNAARFSFQSEMIHVLGGQIRSDADAECCTVRQKTSRAQRDNVPASFTRPAQSKKVFDSAGECLAKRAVFYLVRIFAKFPRINNSRWWRGHDLTYTRLEQLGNTLIELAYFMVSG